MAIAVGAPAPDFTLKGPDGEPVSLSSFRGSKSVVLVFFPLAFSGLCTRQLTDIGAHAQRYVGAGAQVLGVSVDSHHVQRVFSESLGLTDAILLADFHPKGAVARAYDVYREDVGFAGRTTFVIDKGGVVRHVEAATSPDVPDEDACFTALAALEN